MVRDMDWDGMEEGKCPWTNEELKLVDVVVRMMEVDPTFEWVERVFEKALRLVREMKEGRGSS